ncbi:hypothetical protein KIH74_30605 [Kineosporia sp. J2-2]|uniref:Uncharacterized protein n=1 Tax=Kineosporia corallincola TaxID=2835133 RepID=A0ABS5TR69_9ACTN|nr:hypothetical protein [Kineosporia corallincola]MBT0773336.1 hypothetical protein [Kineosporia corallincola]
MTDAWIAVGGIHLLNGSAALSATEPVALLRVPPPAEELPVSTVVVHWDRLGACPATAPGTGRRAVLEGAGLFPHGVASAALAGLLPASASALVPLCYLTGSAEEGYHVYAQVRFLAQDACFVRITPEPVGAGAVEELNWLRPGLAAHAGHALFLNNHQRYYRKAFPGQELEYKYNLEPVPDIWALTVELNRRLHAGELTGYLPEYRDEFQAWDYGNHLFEVTAPEAERGYVSFIPTTDGKNLMKRKWYVEDSFARREEHTYGLTIDPADFGRYVRTELGVEVRPLPPFRRVRYDVNFESVRTGHVYGIFFDRCSLYDDPDVVLSQCELEYLRTRSPLEPDEKAALAELEQLAHWLEGYLTEHGLPATRTFYSKKTFLKDAVAARPGPAEPA